MVEPGKPKSKPKLTDAERHKRFVEVARKVGAAETTEAFNKAFTMVSSVQPKKKETSSLFS
jgi:hypothetical protein